MIEDIKMSYCSSTEVEKQLSLCSEETALQSYTVFTDFFNFFALSDDFIR